MFSSISMEKKVTSKTSAKLASIHVTMLTYYQDEPLDVLSPEAEHMNIQLLSQENKRHVFFCI